MIGGRERMKSGDFSISLSFYKTSRRDVNTRRDGGNDEETGEGGGEQADRRVRR